MICPNCQTEMPDGVKFCPSCGSSVAAAVSDSVMPVEAAIEQIPSVDEKISSEMPNGSFDPGAPIAIPKKKEEPQIVENVEAAAPVETVPEEAPVESVLPEYPQTPAAPVAPAPIPAPISEPIPSPVATPSLTPDTVPAPIANEKSFSISGEDELDKKSEQKVMSTGTAFWLMLLFSIPVVGLIASIIASCVGKKCKSRKNFAKAALIWQILAIIVALSLVIVCYFLFREVFDAAMSGDMAEFSDALNEALGL